MVAEGKIIRNVKVRGGVLKRWDKKHNVIELKSGKSSNEVSLVTLQEEITTARSRFEAALVDKFAFSNDNAIFKYIHGLLKSNALPNTVTFGGESATSDVDKAHLFNTFFHSVFLSDVSSPSFSSLSQPAVFRCHWHHCSKCLLRPYLSWPFQGYWHWWHPCSSSKILCYTSLFTHSPSFYSMLWAILSPIGVEDPYDYSNTQVQW